MSPPRSFIVRPTNTCDEVLLLKFTVTSDEVEFNYNGGLATLKIDRENLAKSFEETDHVLCDGTFNFLISSDGVSNLDDADFYSADDWNAIIGDGSTFAKILMSHFDMLITAYKGMVLNHETLESIVRAAVMSALLNIYKDDPIVGNKFRLPTIDQIAGALFMGRCDFEDPLASLLAMLDGRKDSKPQLAHGVIQIKGVNIRTILDRNDGIRFIVDYLPNDNIFEEAFHDDLVARLQPMLTHELVRSVIQDELAMVEIKRRALERKKSAMMEVYGFHALNVAMLADEMEKNLREELLRWNQAERDASEEILIHLCGGALTDPVSMG